MPAAENTGAGAGGAEVITQVTSGDDTVPPYPTSWSSDYPKATFPTDASPQSQLKGDDDYAVWVEKMNIGWRIAGLWNLVTGVHPRPQTDDPAGVAAAWEKMNNAAISIIYNAVDGTMVTGLARFSEAREMWESLTTKHAGGGMGSLLNKVRRLNSLYDANETTMGNHTTHFTGIITEIKQAGFIIPDFFAAAIFLSTLPYHPDVRDNYASFVEAQTLTPQTKLDAIIGAANDHFKLKSSSSGDGNPADVEAQALLVLKKSFAARGQYFCVNCQKSGHSKEYCRQPGGGKYTVKKKGGKGKKNSKAKEKAKSADDAGGGESSNFVLESAIQGTSATFSTYSPMSDSHGNFLNLSTL